MSDQAGVLKVTLYENKNISLTYTDETTASAISTGGDTIEITNQDLPNLEININSGHNRNNLFDGIISFTNWNNTETTQDLLDQITESVYGWIALVEFYNGEQYILPDPLFNLESNEMNSAISHDFDLVLQHDVDSNQMPILYSP